MFLTKYLSMGLGIALVIVSLAGLALWNRLGACHADRATEKAAFSAKLTEFDAALLEQNQAIEEWQEKAARAGEAGKAALEKARMAGRSLQAEADRLRALKGQKPVTGCPAAEAVKRVRDGLGK